MTYSAALSSLLSHCCHLFFETSLFQNPAIWLVYMNSPYLNSHSSAKFIAVFLMLATTSGVNFRPVCSPKYKVIVKVFLLVFRWTLYWLPWPSMAILFRWFVLNYLLQRNVLVALEERSRKRHALQRIQECTSVCSVDVSLCWWDPFSRCFC